MVSSSFPEHDASHGLHVGLYERLITEQLAADLEAAQDKGFTSWCAEIKEDETAARLAAFLGEIAERSLKGVDANKRVELANAVLRVLAGKGDGEVVAAGPKQLLAVTREEAPGVHRIYHVRPTTPLSNANLLTNGPDDVNLANELRAELATVDRVDLICAFVRWAGLRLLDEQLLALKRRAIPIRVLTTTYMGATERRAIDELVRRYGAQVRICYETRATRLHAKAWLLSRNSGFHTAYVGSSNLSKSALLDGLEWNVRLSGKTTPHVLDKFSVTFEAYWNDTLFEGYDPDNLQHVRRLDQALAVADAKEAAVNLPTPSESSHVEPFRYQSEMLEKLDVERRLHGHKENLVVAATGTGKTVLAALDYRRLCAEHGSRLKLLFVAHRKEILTQARKTYRSVLGDQNFGELLVDGEKPTQCEHVFASVQSLRSSVLKNVDPKHFDVVVVDECHHAPADSYQRLLKHVDPLQLLGLTATPERTDGEVVQDLFFGGRIAAELRLWDALEADLLCPFHYFGIGDGVDLRALEWKRGAYASADLEKMYVDNDARAKLIISEVRLKAVDPDRMRALGFCVSLAHARYMASQFNAAGITAKVVVGETSTDERTKALHELREGSVRILFTVDLFNEGLDIPEIDTILLLRPTASSTIFLQQLGRGLRRCPGKTVLTVLDFIGQQRREFRFESRFAALTGVSGKRLEGQVDHDFPRLPPGCQIVLDKVAKEVVLDSIRAQLSVNSSDLVKEIRECATSDISLFLEKSGRKVSDLYRSSSKRNWSSLRRAAGLQTPPAGPKEARLLRRNHVFSHVDDPYRADLYKKMLSDNAPRYGELTSAEQALARMLFYGLWADGGGFASYEEGFASLAGEAAARQELSGLIDFGMLKAEHVPSELSSGPGGLPLLAHAHYSLAEALAGLGWAGLGASAPANFKQGVVWIPQIETDAFFITIDKDEKAFSAETMYKDYALSPTRFHWESQNTASPTTSTGRRYLTHRENGTHIVLFARQTESTDRSVNGAAPYLFLGTGHYVEHKGERPIAITWELDPPLPTDVFMRMKATTA